MLQINAVHINNIHLKLIGKDVYKYKLENYT